MAKLRPMSRKRFTSPVAMLDALAFNIAEIGKKLGVEISTGFSVIRFMPAFGETALSYTVKVGEAEFKSNSNGYAEAIVERGVESEYTITAEGYEAVKGSVLPEVENIDIQLSRFVALPADADEAPGAGAGAPAVPGGPAGDIPGAEDPGIEEEVTLTIKVKPAEAEDIAVVRMNGKDGAVQKFPKGACVNYEVLALGYTTVSACTAALMKSKTITITLEPAEGEVSGSFRPEPVEPGVSEGPGIE